MQLWPYSLKSKFQNRQICQRLLEPIGIVYTEPDASGASGASGAGSKSKSHDHGAPWWQKGNEDDDPEETWGNWGKDQEHRGVKRRHNDT